MDTTECVEMAAKRGPFVAWERLHKHSRSFRVVIDPSKSDAARERTIVEVGERDAMGSISWKRSEHPSDRDFALCSAINFLTGTS